MVARAAAVDPPVNYSYAPQLIWAAVTVLVATGILVGLAGVWYRKPKVEGPHGGLVTGPDNRYSTGKVMAVGWTLLVAWMIVTEAYIAIVPATKSFSELMSNASDLYFVLLGGPYAAAAFAKATTQSKLARGTLTKTPAGSPTPKDVIADDNGNVDLYDFQYTLFNILAVVIVAGSFRANPALGLPDIPQFLAILTGGAALTYTVNKSIAADGPQITSVKPDNARIGDIISITGVSLFDNAAGAALPTVKIGTISATNVNTPPGSTNTLIATVTEAPANTTRLSGPCDVTVTPPQASPIVLHNGVTVVPDSPKIHDVMPKPFKASGPLTVTGSLLLSPGNQDGTASDEDAAGGLTVELSASGLAWPVKFDGAFSNDVVGLKVGAAPPGLPGAVGETRAAVLKLKRDGKTVQSIVEYERGP